MMNRLHSFLNISQTIRRSRRWGLVFLWLSMVLLAALPEAIAWRDGGRYAAFWMSPFAAVYLLIVFSVLGMFYGLSNHYGLAWVLTFVPVSLVSLINQMKYVNNSKPLFPWDILIVWEGLKAANSMADPRKTVLLTLGVCVVFLVVGGMVLLMLPRFSFKQRRQRGIMLVACAAVFAGISIQQRLADRGPGPADLQAEYRDKGFVTAFLNNITGLPKIEVRDYDKEVIAEIASDLPKPRSPRAGFQPDIIVFVSESFFDMTKLPEVHCSEPVNPFFQTLKQQHHLRWYSPSFGGQTANAEFEMLTGFPLVLFSPQVVPYRLYLRKPTHSIASVLNSAGYTSIFIHPYQRNFWSRNTVIPNLGFDKFIALEDMKHTETRGEFVSDDALVSEAITFLENEEQPVFLYLMTIQNHYPFEAGRYDQYNDAVSVHSDLLTDAENATLKSYANGVLDSDRALRRLVEHLQVRDRPALVLFQGDHLPSLDGSRIYEKLGVDLEDGLSRYEVDGVVWSNYSLDVDDSVGCQMCYLPMKVLQWAGQPMSVYFRFLETLCRDYPIVHSEGIYDSTDSRVPFSDFFASEKARDLKLLVYDLMFGKAYSTKIEDN